MKKENKIEELDNADILKIRGIKPELPGFGSDQDTGDSLLQQEEDNDLPYPSFLDEDHFEFFGDPHSTDNDYLECQWRKRNRRDRLQRKFSKKHTDN